MDLVSLDEYLGSKTFGGHERKEFARDDGTLLKAVPLLSEKASKFNAETDSIRFVMSAEIEDRDRDIVIQAGLDTTEFLKNPVGPWAHNNYMPPVGTWSEVQKELNGRPKRTEGTFTLVKGEDMADRLRAHFKAGSVRACSIGFMPKEIERREKPNDIEGYYYPGYKIHKAELYECSPCTIPANPAALAKAAKEGDVAALRDLQKTLEEWDLKNGVLVPRERFEAAHKEATGDRTLVVLGGKSFLQAAGEKGVLTLTPVEPTAEEKLVDAIERDTPEGKTLLSRIAKALGLKGKETENADPAPGQQGTKPAEPQGETKDALEQMVDDLPEIERRQLEAREFEIEMAAREAALDDAAEKFAA